MKNINRRLQKFILRAFPAQRQVGLFGIPLSLHCFATSLRLAPPIPKRDFHLDESFFYNYIQNKGTRKTKILGLKLFCLSCLDAS